jgi:hypothetical protein
LNFSKNDPKSSRGEFCYFVGVHPFYLHHTKRRYDDASVQFLNPRNFKPNGTPKEKTLKNGAVKLQQRGQQETADGKQTCETKRASF